MFLKSNKISKSCWKTKNRSGHFNKCSMATACIAQNKKTKYTKILCVFCLIYAWLFFLPLGISSKKVPYSFALYDKNGTLIGARVASDGQWRFEGDKVPYKFEKALISFEDKRFYFHNGIDFISIFRACISNIKQKRIVSGGSTITMQTVRILEGNPPRTFLQKVHESWIAFLLELRCSKKQILSLYAANAPFGGNVVGLEAASWRYFHRSPQNLTWAESATLAVLPNQPSLVFPGSNKKILQKKRDNLLLKLYKEKIIDKETLELSLAETLPKKPYPLPTDASHFLEFQKKTNKEKTKFYSSLDGKLQKNVARILESWSTNFAKKGINNAAALVIDTQSGKILAYCGNSGLNGRNESSNEVDIIQSKRSSGSLLKPFLFAAMLDSGQLLPNQLVPDTPTRIGSYRPDNNIPTYSGAVPAAEALSRSLNIPAVKELQIYGISAFLTYLKECGFTTFNRQSDEYGLPLILGGGEITLFEATKAYSSMMKKACFQNEKAPFSVGAAWLTLEALQNGIRPDEEAMWQTYANSKKIAWKTGTSSGNRDAWAIGTTKEFTVGVWVGNAEGNGSKDLTSVSTSAPLMFDIFSILEQTSWPLIPNSELKELYTCSKSGYLASTNCEETKIALKPKNAPYGKSCPYCKTITLTPDLKFQATVEDMIGIYENCMPVQKKYFVLPQTMEYYYTKHAIGYKKLPPFVDWHNSYSQDNFEIMFPQQNANIAIPVEIDGNYGAFVMEATSRNSNEELFWDLDGEYLGKTKKIHQMKINPKNGLHTLTVTDSKGGKKTRTFSIVDIEN